MKHLLQNFYSITTIDARENLIEAEIKLNATHKIYQGHFPEVPVVPGVCQMQMVKELLSEVLQSQLVLQNADNMKFMAVINPLVNGELSVKIDYKNNPENLLRVNSTIFYGSTVFFKFTGNFIQLG